MHVRDSELGLSTHINILVSTSPTYDAGQVDQLLLTSRVESVPGILISQETKVFLIFGI